MSSSLAGETVNDLVIVSTILVQTYNTMISYLRCVVSECVTMMAAKVYKKRFLGEIMELLVLFLYM